MNRRMTRRRAGAIGSCSVLALALAGGIGTSRAEDIDIYMSKPADNAVPNVLLVIDNSANWSADLPVEPCYYKDNGAASDKSPPANEQAKKIGLEKCALNNVIDALGKDTLPSVNLGVMLFNDHKASESGGYPRIAFTPVSKDTRESLKAAVRGIWMDKDKGNNAAFAKSLHEAYLYYAGEAPHVGHKGTKFDRDAFVDGSFSRYKSPSFGTCSRNYVIFIANGSPGETTDNEAKALLAGLRGNTERIDYPSGLVSNSDQGNWADEYTRFMAEADVSNKEGAQAITTYTVAVTGAKSDNNYPNFIEGMAHHGGGNYYAARSTEGLEKFLLEIFQQISAVDSAFVSASLPVSVNSRGTYLNQVYMGLFRPDAAAAPRWRGNLKQYQFKYNVTTQSLQLADAAGASAISSGESGFFDPGAKSFWTSGSDFWKNEPMGTPRSPSDMPDGEIVEKGGAAQRLRSQFLTSVAARKVFTCIGCPNGTTLGGGTTKFDAANTAVTSALLGVADERRSKLIDWIRGADNATGVADGDVPREKGPGGSVAIRPSVHGDVLHGRPVVVNYGGSIGAVVFYGANDGMLHAINGNQAGTGAGNEFWAFVPEEGLPNFKRLRANSPTIRFTNTIDEHETAEPRDYFFDGPLSFYQKIGDGGTAEKVYLYAGMRRGGRALYAFDVTDPAAPIFMWKIDHRDPEFKVLGQTWSEAKVARIKGHEGPVIVMGAGYDAAAQDFVAVDGESGPAVSMGNAVLIIDAVTGKRLKQFDTQHPVAADLSLVDANYDGLIDRGYAADLGGNVWRIDFESGDSTGPEAWTMRRFASLGGSGPAPRKIFYPPDVVLTRDYAVVLVGTGDREKPLELATNERFFTLIDRSNPGEYPIDGEALVEQSAFAAVDSETLGCYVPMSGVGEKIVNAPLTAGGVTYFSTNRPNLEPTNSCNDLGQARVYGVPLVCQTPKMQNLKGGGLPPSPVTGNVEITTGTDANGDPIVRRVPFIIGGFNEKRSAIEGSKVELAVPPRRKRLYWFNEADR